MPSFEVPVEEIISRRTVHIVDARDASHASALVRSMLSDGNGGDIPMMEETLRKVICAPSHVAVQDVTPVQMNPVRSIIGLSLSEIASIPGPIVVGDLVVHTQNPIVYWRGKLVKMSKRLYRMMLELALNVDRVVARYDLLDAVDNTCVDVFENVCDSNIKVLRRCLRAVDPSCEPISVVTRIGYRLDSQACGVPRRCEQTDARLVIDAIACEAFVDGKLLHLAPATFQLLFAMAKHPGMIFDRDAIIRHGCPLTSSSGFSPASSGTAIKNIRAAVFEACGHKEIILTHYGLGFSLHPNIGKPVLREEYA